MAASRCRWTSGSVLAVLHGNDAPAMQDIRAGLLESLAHPIGSEASA